MSNEKNEKLAKLVQECTQLKNRLGNAETDFELKAEELEVSLSELELFLKNNLSIGLEEDNSDNPVIEITEQERDLNFYEIVRKRREERLMELYCPYPTYNSTIEGLMALRLRCGYAAYLRQHIYFTMHDEKYSIHAMNIFILVMLSIIASTLAYILSTIPALEESDVWDWTEFAVSIIFTLEYLMRIMTVRAPQKYFWEPLNLVDLLAILPFYLEQISGFGGSVMRIIRVVRLARLTRLRASPSVIEWMEVLTETMKKTLHESLAMIFSLVFFEVIIFSSLVYVAEQPFNEKFNSIPNAAWWCIVTITCVGYGDMSPTTVVGQLLGTLTLLSGLIVMAIFVIICGSNFDQVYKKFRRQKKRHENRIAELNLLESMQEELQQADDPIVLEPRETTSAEDNPKGDKPMPPSTNGAR